MNLILPAGPREYWNKMAAFKAEHSRKSSAKGSDTASSKGRTAGGGKERNLDWLWEADPFEAQNARDAARAEREKQRAKDAQVKQAVERGDHEVAAALGGGGGSSNKMSKIWAEARELYLPARVRELIEKTVRKGFEVFPSAASNGTSTGSSDTQKKSFKGSDGSSAAAKALQQNLVPQIQKLGFRRGYAVSATEWVASARARLDGDSAVTTATGGPSDGLLAAVATQTDIDAAIEYLMIYTPEEDLPPRYRIGTNTGASSSARREDFVTSAAAAAGPGGGSDLNLRWAQDRIAKQLGAPRKAVEEASALLMRWEKQVGEQDVWPKAWRQSLLVDLLVRRLAAIDREDWTSESCLKMALHQAQAAREEAREQTLEDERIAIQAILGHDRVKILTEEDWPRNTSEAGVAFQAFDISVRAPDKEELRLRVIFHPANGYCSSSSDVQVGTSVPTFFAASSTLPTYIRLALTQRLYQSFAGPNATPELVDSASSGAGGAVLLLVEQLEQIASEMIQHPPQLSRVMEPLLDQPKDNEPADEAEARGSSTPGGRTQRKRNTHGDSAVLRRNGHVDEAMAQRYAQWHQSPGYRSFKSVREGLPAWASRTEVLELLESNRVLIIAGETGCGKTTQCPQFILDDYIQKQAGSECNIVVTQPRRVSAMGVAARVAAERGESLESSSSAGLVGYAIRGERKASRECRLLFTTTGVLLRRLGSGGDPDLKGFSHIVVDEVHERSVDGDFLLLELREVLKRNPKLKVVLMSATIQQVSPERTVLF